MVLFLMVEVDRSVRSGLLERVIEETGSGCDHVDKRSGDEATSKGEPEDSTYKEPTERASWWSPEPGPVEGQHHIRRQSRHHETPG